MLVIILKAEILLAVGSQLPKSGTARYEVNTGTTKNRESAKEYLQNVHKITKKCGLYTLILDRNTNIREGSKSI